MESWIKEQLSEQIEQFDKSMEIYYPDSKTYTQDASLFLKRITEDCNYFDAIKSINFENYLLEDSSVLDLAGGIGWLTAHLSKLSKIKKIFFLDSSKYYIKEMLPKVMNIMGANQDKVFPIEGIFIPLKFDDNSLDCVVISSSLHHADNLESVLCEIKRVLKKNGFLFILNETPSSYKQYLKSMILATIKIIRNTVFKKYISLSQTVSSNGILYDPYLGDKDYPIWFWLEAIRLSGFSLEEKIDSKLSTVKGKKGRNLIHFICKK